MTYKERAEKVLAQGTGTYSKRWDQLVDGVYDTHAIGGQDGVIWFPSGKKIDFVNGLGSNLLPGSMNNFSVPHVLEVEVAENIIDRIKCIDKLKFLKTGSAACVAAVRIARAYTGRERVLGIGYHGWHNIFISAEIPGKGCAYERYYKFNTLDDLLQYFDIDTHFYNYPVAAIIIEPVMLELNVYDKLMRLRELCTKYRIVLIYDEIVTGFRVPQYCIANYFDIKPDLICLGKAMANGWPISVVGGRQSIMDTLDYFISTTFSGELASLEKAKEAITYITKERLEDLWLLGIDFQQSFNEISDKIQLYGLPTRMAWKGEEVFKAIFWQEMWKRGYFLGKLFFLSFNHTQDILDTFLLVAKEVIKEIEAGKIKLEGSLPKEVFKRF
jgi:glutamate-1-semialdehyde aminotransferase